MPRTSQKTIAAKPKTNTRLSKKPPLTPAQLKQVDAWWRASNYLSACQLYLLDNPLLKRPLAASDLKQTIVGHWGTVPGQNFIYTHLNRVIQKDDLDMIYLSGPGHGGNAMVAQDWLDGTYTEVYPNITQDEDGMRKLFKQFSFPGGVPSHVAPETPGSINEGGELRDEISGEVTVALPAGRENLLFSSADSIVVCGDQPDMIKRALELRVSCVIVCQAEVSRELLELDTDTCIISTPYDAYRAVHLICHSLPIERICKSHDLVSFHLDDYIDDVRNTVLESRFRAYPILDENEHVVGTLSRFHLLRPRRKRVILVDHNEKAQSVPGLDQADILEIVDHHRLADIETNNPIYVRNEPVGSSTTIVADMYQEKGLMPSAKMAGLMAAAIVSDTVMFKSPTCTQRDIDIANRMSRIANVSLEELGQTIFSAATGEDKSAESIIRTDYKEFHIGGHNLAVSQITCLDSDRLMARKEEFLATMETIRKKNGLDIVLLMITNVLVEGSYLLYSGDTETIRQAFNITGEEKNCVFLSKIMSRKKQIIPSLSALWG